MFIGQPDLAAPAAPTSSVETGLIVLSMDGRILHTNDRAHEFARHFTNEPRRLQAPATTPLRHPLMDLFHDVLANLEKHIAAEDWSQFEITRLARWGGGTVRLRGFGIPDQARRQQSRVVLTVHYQSSPSPW
ncbi:MAG: hypothetical protein WAU44_00205 [Nitrospira sp.]|jgi:hypothetical protein|uniref:hypothetical protein n=1 Tax=Nitrospira sp. ND1 TaxID=1658518 RepID=UPI0009BBDC93|nr:hypothetical protein [Nitrospira sp. ND1]MBK7418210.1 hypothetical protein [Nitrospira sp.]MBK7484749.1 hypothetical protein [Nitrospira sp.]MBK8376808.1 hypothetical protein [Nitrospira sp.]MBK9999323.1 hypothetical protein [Nitrospira sp.]MBP6205687.1 hypothetical protein [Nitrospira sp.]